MTQPPRVRYCAQKELPLDLASIIDTLRQMREEMQRAAKPIHEAVKDLEKDWSKRSFTFWYKELEALQSLKPTVQTWLKWLQGPLAQNDGLLIITPIRYELILVYAGVETSIDQAGICITSYLPVCESMEEQHLHQRQRAFEELQSVDEQIQTILKKAGVRGQRACIRAYEANRKEVGR